ncbi:hypothetical protein OUZ56_032365 [Daphnia magna]|uniref:Uncharacterized protein n=1 Tax=Daphnia magna TaxID=35525 RepID=A0ABR0B8R1_9CRUS|nr:hypothetical protein OUZ56_032365 [Daphnia magna]
MLTVFVEGRRTDAAQLAASEGRLQKIRRVHAPAGGASADDHVNFVDEENAIALLFNRLNDGLQTLFELATELSSGDDGPHVERVDGGVGEGSGDVPLDDASRQPLDNRCFSDAWVAEKQRVVLFATGEDLDDALYLRFAADEGIDASGAGLLVEVVGEVLERVGRCVPFALLGPLAGDFALVVDFGHAVRNVGNHVDACDAVLLKEIDDVTVALREDGDKHRLLKLLLVSPRVAHNLCGFFVEEERIDEVFECDVLMAPAGRFVRGDGEGDFDFRADAHERILGGLAREAQRGDGFGKRNPSRENPAIRTRSRLRLRAPSSREGACRSLSRDPSLHSPWFRRHRADKFPQLRAPFGAPSS